MPQATWPFAPLRRRHYRTIACDPPWAFRSWSAAGLVRAPQRHYACLTLPTLLDLPVGELAHRDGCALLLWFSSPFLQHAMACLEAWGFRYVALGAWGKLNAAGDPSMGLGYWYRSAAEFWLFGVRGSVTRQDRGVRNLLLEARREHSRKPDAFYATHAGLFPGPRCDLFARQRRRGWSAWGDQPDRFGG